jgi:uncharacterized protein (DUF2062 family)
MGWRRTGRYMVHKVGRMPGSPYSIAAGLACGAAVSFTPFIGFHFLLAALLAWLLGAGILASAVGTVVGNPWTFPAIWIATYRLGRMLLGMEGHAAMAEGLTMQVLIDSPGRLLLPMTVGGMVLGVVAWFVTFLLMRRLIAGYHAARLRRCRAGNTRTEQKA